MELTIEEYEKINPVATVEWGGKQIRFATPNSFTVFRVQSLSSKEPDTMAWIAGFNASDVLLDVGANVGMYTVWAAATRGVRVFAFEPESQNYALLNRNIHYNKLADLVSAYGVALSDHTGVDQLHLGEFLPGGSCHTFGEKLDYKLEPLSPIHSQGCFSTTIDELIANGHMPVPTHIKIDVDGIEHKVLAGAERTLNEPGLISVLVELNTNLEVHRRIIDDMTALGFKLSPEQVEAAIRKKGAFKGVGNHIFRR